MGFFYIRKNALGKDGMSFNCYKIRTMVPNAEEILGEVSKNSLDQYGKIIGDDRINGKFSSFLRRFGIDELPQLYNIYLGEMKLVGIRPLNKKEWRRYPDSLKERALIHLPGLMGVQYASREKGGFDLHVKLLEQYLDEYEQNPAQTDKRYFHQILENIVLHRVRSS